MRNIYRCFGFIGIMIVNCIFIGCRAQSNEQRIRQTTNSGISAIKNEAEIDFLSLIGSELHTMGKDEKMVKGDVKSYHEIFNTYFQKRDPIIILTDSFNFLGQRLVTIPIYNNNVDSLSTKTSYLPFAKKLSLDILFGPPDLFSLNKITGYELRINDENLEDFKPLSHWKH